MGESTMQRVMTWAEWLKYFRRGKTPATYLSGITVATFIIATIQFRSSLLYMVLGIAGILASYGGFIDMIAHLLWLHGYAYEPKISWRDYVRKFFQLREHVVLSYIACIALLVVFGHLYLFEIPVVLATLYFVVSVKYYH